MENEKENEGRGKMKDKLKFKGENTANGEKRQTGCLKSKYYRTMDGRKIPYRYHLKGGAEK